MIPLATIRDVWAVYSAAKGYPPSLRQVAQQVGRATSTVWGACQRLREAGYIDWEPGTARTIRVIIPLIEMQKEEISANQRSN